MKRLNRALHIGGLVLLFAATQHAQESTCKLKLADAPVLRGFRLGMTVDDLKKRYPKFHPATADPDGYVHQGFFIGADELSEMSAADRDGLGGLVFSFFDDKLMEFELDYNGFTAFGSIGAFVDAISTKLKFPGGAAWQEVDPKTRRLACDGFTATIKFEKKQSKYETETQALIITDDHSAKLLKERKANGPEQRRKIFKP